MRDITNPETFVEPRWLFCSGRQDKLTYEEYFLKRAYDELAPLYSCNRPPGAAGAVLETKANVILAPVIPTIGYPSCKDSGCDLVDGHCVRSIHAERRALLWAAQLGIPTKYGVMYSILKPCYECTKEIIAAGISAIYFAGIAYNEQRTIDILAAARVTCIHIDIGLEYGK